MAFVETANITRSRSLALQGFLFVCALIPFALLDFRFGLLSVSGLWIPLIGVYIWPRGAETSTSTIWAFFAGLLLDLVSDSPTGLWALIFVLTLLIMQPNKRAANVTRQALWLGFVMWLVIVALWMWGLSVVSSTQFLSWRPMIFQLVVAGLVFPIVHGIARYARHLATDPADRVET